MSKVGPMSIHVALHHHTTYRYDRPIDVGPQLVRLRPAAHCRTPILSYSLKVEPANHFINWQQDPQGNWLARLVFPEKTDRFEVSVDVIADMAVVNPFDFFLEPEAEHYPFVYDAALSEDLAPFRKTTPPGPLLAAWLAKVDREGNPRTVDFLVRLNQRLQGEIGYLIRMEPGVQTFEQTLGLAKGSCRDTGWLLVNILRHLGFATRFVSGYLIQLQPDEKPLGGPEGPTHDFTDLHAWRGLSAGRRLDRPRPHLGPAGRRGAHPAGLHARAAERGTDRGIGREGRCPLRLRHGRDTRARDAAHDQTLRGRYLAPDPGAGRGDRRPPLARRHAPVDGRRANLRVDRRHGRRGVEYCGVGAGQASPCRPSVPPPRVALRPGPAAALWPGQMVSRRAAAALGADLPLAARWRADLARAAADRTRGEADRRDRGSGRPLRRASPSVCSSIPAICCPPSRTPGTTCGASGACR